MKYSLDTDIVDEKIIQTLILNSHMVQNQVEFLSRWVCDTRERSIRDALIYLGWKPPEGDK